MPTSVLLAILVAAGLLALAPALVRRHDAVERQVAERAQSTARVLSRNRRRRSVPGRRPVNRSRTLLPTLRTAAPVSGGDRRPSPRLRRDGRDRRDHPDHPDHRPDRPDRPDRGAVDHSDERDRGRVARPVRWDRSHRRRASPAIYWRRRILAALLLLNVVELTAVAVVGPGLWVGFAVTATLLLSYLVHLRSVALADQRRRRIEARRAARLAAQQAEVRRAQQRRALERRQAARRMAEQRESLRRAAATRSASSTVLYRAVPPRRPRAG